MDKSVWLRYDKVERGTWLVSRSQTAFTVKAVWLRETSARQRCRVSAEFIEKLQGMRSYNLANCICCRFQESASVQLKRSHCYRHAQASSASFLSRIRAPLMSQSMHLLLRPIQTIYLCQSMTGLVWSRSVMSWHYVGATSRSYQEHSTATLALRIMHYVCCEKSHAHALTLGPRGTCGESPAQPCPDTPCPELHHTWTCPISYNTNNDSSQYGRKKRCVKYTNTLLHV